MTTENNETKPAETAIAKAAPQPQQLTPRVRAQETGVIIGGSLEDQYRLARYYAASGLMPNSFRTPEQVLVGMQLCYELGLPVVSSMKSIMVVNGVPSLFGDLPLALVRKSGKLKSIDEYVLDQKGARICEENKNLEAIPFRAVCKVQRQGEDTIVTRMFSVEEAKVAGLFGKKGDIWKSYTKRMLQMRARSHALKDLFSDILMGVAIGEYDFNETLETAQDRPTVNVDQPATLAGELAARFGVAKPETIDVDVVEGQPEASAQAEKEVYPTEIAIKNEDDASEFGKFSDSPVAAG